MVEQWAKTLTEQTIGGAPFAVGDIVRHPDGRNVKITSGQYWGQRGLSNFWYWREVDAQGVIVGPEEHGYGWRPRARDLSRWEAERTKTVDDFLTLEHRVLIPQSRPDSLRWCLEAFGQPISNRSWIRQGESGFALQRPLEYMEHNAVGVWQMFKANSDTDEGFLFLFRNLNDAIMVKMQFGDK